MASLQEFAYCVSGNSTVFNKSFLLNYIRNSRSEEQLVFVLSGPLPDALGQDPVTPLCFRLAPISTLRTPPEYIHVDKQNYMLSCNTL